MGVVTEELFIDEQDLLGSKTLLAPLPYGWRYFLLLLGLFLVDAELIPEMEYLVIFYFYCSAYVCVGVCVCL